ncbi:MAG: hypothetical protein QMD03_02995 [Syntrophales bacterium]|nr:hypothetical protein [Syntrophales bacterium]
MDTKSEMKYAHSLPGRPPDRWQPLDDHLKQVAELSRSFVDEFRAGNWGTSLMC